MVLKPYKSLDKLPTSTGACRNSEPSTVWPGVWTFRIKALEFIGNFTILMFLAVSHSHLGKIPQLQWYAWSTQKKIMLHQSDAHVIGHEAFSHKCVRPKQQRQNLGTALLMVSTYLSGNPLDPSYPCIFGHFFIGVITPFTTRAWGPPFNSGTKTPNPLKSHEWVGCLRAPTKCRAH